MRDESSAGRDHIPDMPATRPSGTRNGGMMPVPVPSLSEAIYSRAGAFSPGRKFSIAQTSSRRGLKVPESNAIRRPSG